MTDSYTDPDDLKRAKTALRAHMAASRGAIAQGTGAEGTSDAANLLSMNLMTAIAPTSGTTVSGYWPMRHEIDPRPCLTAAWSRGCRIALPVVPEDKGPLIFRAWEPDEELLPGPFGTSEPGPESEVVYPDLMLIPLLAFDRTGRRLGYGGGYYDRTLAALRGAKAVRAIGVAYSAQEVDIVPAGSHDALLDGVVTEAGYLDFAE